MSAGSNLQPGRRRIWAGRWVLALSLLAACTGPAARGPATTRPELHAAGIAVPAPRTAWPTWAVWPGTPADYHAAARSEDGSLELYVRDTNASLRVVDTRSAHVWTSVPEGAADNPDLAGVWKRRSPIPLALEYTGPDHSSIKVVRPEDLHLTVTPVERGAQVEVAAPTAGFTLTVYILLRHDALEISVPEASIQESGENGLVSVQILPFFGAALDTDPGYMVYPDGSGMLVRFGSPHRTEVQETSRPVYGPDLLTPPTTALEPFARQPVVLPVFGLTTGTDGFLGEITLGDFDAAISLARSGEGMPYNRVWGELVYRRQGMFSLNGEQPVVLYQPDRIGGDRQVRYLFLTGQADYAAMAARYRAELMDQGVRRLTGELPRLNLRFFMGVEQRTWFLRNLIRLTTTADAQAMLDQLAAQGVTAVDVTLEGWNQGGAQARYPQRLPAEAGLGGAAGIQALAQSLHARGQRLFLLDNYLDILPGSRGAFPIMDAVRGVDGLPVGDGEAGYYLNPQVALRQFAVPDLPRLAELGADGVYVRDFAAVAAPDANLRYPLSRENFAATWMTIADLARTTLGHVTLEGGNGYALGHAERLENVPLDATGYDLSDETIPFYAMVVHGLVQYSGEPIDLSSDPHRAFLRHVAAGATPVFVLTYNDTALLYRTTANTLWTGQFATWQAEVAADYTALQALVPLQSQFMTASTSLADGVVQVTYESGTRVVVNYNDTTYVSATVSVPPQDFVVLP